MYLSAPEKATAQTVAIGTPVGDQTEGSVRKRSRCDSGLGRKRPVQWNEIRMCMGKRVLLKGNREVRERGNRSKHARKLKWQRKVRRMSLGWVVAFEFQTVVSSTSVGRRDSPDIRGHNSWNHMSPKWTTVQSLLLFGRTNMTL